MRIRQQWNTVDQGRVIRDSVFVAREHALVMPLYSAELRRFVGSTEDHAREALFFTIWNCA